MRRRETITAALGLASLAVPGATAFAAGTTADAAAKTKTTVVTRKVSGSPTAADRWGEVTIVVTVRKTTTVKNRVKKVTRKVTNIGGSFSYHTDRSLYIMQQALPLLRQQALRTLNADKVDIISGATYTSEAFIGSLQEALAKAKKV